MTFDSQFVLCFGRDKLLLDTRRKLLQRAGYAALATSDESTVEESLLNGDVSILILCHTLSDAEVERISKLHRETSSPASILYLSKGDRIPAVHCRHVYNAHSGPAAFIAAVSKLGTRLAISTSR